MFYNFICQKCSTDGGSCQKTSFYFMRTVPTTLQALECIQLLLDLFTADGPQQASPEVCPGTTKTFRLEASRDVFSLCPLFTIADMRHSCGSATATGTLFGGSDCLSDIGICSNEFLTIITFL